MTIKFEPTTAEPNKANRFKRPFSRLYAKSIFTGYTRGLRNQHENTVLLQIEGCLTKQDAWFYVGKKCAFVYKVSKCLMIS